MVFRRAFARTAAVALLLVALPLAAASGGGASSIDSADLREWLTYLSSDDLEGRAVFSSGIGLAAAYIEDHLRTWHVRPAGDNGMYLQTVRVLGVRRTSHSTVRVEVAGESRTFADGEGVRFPANAGARQRLEIDRVEFVGYGLDAPGLGSDDFNGREVAGAAVVWLGASGPGRVDEGKYRRLLNRRSRYALDDRHAAAAITASRLPQTGDSRAQDRPAAAGRGPLPAADFTTVQRLDQPAPPSVTADDVFLTFLFSHSPTPYEELKRKVEARQPLPGFRLDGVKLIFQVDADYEVVRTQLAHNIVGIVEGSDAALANTYVAFGAHYDHIGYAEGELQNGPNGLRRLGAPGRVTPGAEADRIWNGADDDGSGTVSLMALARAYAAGPRPKRSLLFVWHVGEERGLWGSQFFADHPTVPLASIVAQFNIDMVGRNRDDNPEEADTVYLVGSDRISTELDAITRAANQSTPRPMHLDYELNDPIDPEQIYYRSDHYSYASKGIPVIFFTTGLHPDYHANTDEVSKIEFDKLTRVARLVYETGTRVANLDHAPARDNKGPRAGKATATTR
jgi:hypothetical protein